MRRPVLIMLMTGMMLLACGTTTAPLTPTIISGPSLNPTPTSTAVLPATTLPNTAPSPTEEVAGTQPPVIILNISPLAFFRENQLLLTDIVNGAAGGPRALYTATQNESLVSFQWSPDGRFIALVVFRGDQTEIDVIAVDGKTATRNLGPGTYPAWSPDSTRLALVRGTVEGGDNVWVVNIADGQAQPVTNESGWAWGNPAFTLGGMELIVAGSARDNMGASGNTEVQLEQLNLETGKRLPLGAPAFGRLPVDLRLSPDGQYLAYSLSAHVNACASSGVIYLSASDGTNGYDLMSPPLKELVAATPSTTQEYYHISYSYAWSPASDKVALNGFVVNCANFEGTIVGGPLLTVLRLDGTEQMVVPGAFNNPSFSHSGQWLAVEAYENLQAVNASLHVYYAETGALASDVGPGSHPAFQP